MAGGADRRLDTPLDDGVHAVRVRCMHEERARREDGEDELVSTCVAKRTAFRGAFHRPLSGASSCRARPFEFHLRLGAAPANKRRNTLMRLLRDSCPGPSDMQSNELRGWIALLPK